MSASEPTVAEGQHVQPQASAAPTKRTIDTTLDRALTAYTVACREAHAFAPGSEPLLIPYLAGWGCRENPSCRCLSASAATCRRSWPPVRWNIDATG